MSLPEIHVGNIGTVFRFTIKDQAGVVVDLSSQTAMDILFQKPDRTAITRTAVYTTDGLDGQMQYVSVLGDLDQSGQWYRQARVAITAGTFYTELVAFDVKRNIA